MTTIDPSSFSQDPASVSDSAPAAAPSAAAPAEGGEQPSPAATPFAWIGGEPAVRTLVDRFYDLMDLEPEYKELRAAHGTTLADARDKLFWFLCGWLGGPDHYIERFGHPRLRMRHMPFSIGIKERDQWVACMDQAMGETGVPEALRVRLRESFMGTADWMRNRGG
ncbi:group II truncated hemoglobin [Paracidovorax avenae]|uniref:group II truncated hemoglobin n=1 Tax=Paracidovorax avenae TaxID=80867 RepID=UPI000AFE0076|nr:group II truncated hemoglobin [Paracidovorax avenae]